MSGQVHDLIYHLFSIDHYERARQVCLDALKEDPHDGWLLNMLAHIYRKLWDDEACIQAALEALNYETQYEQADTFDTLGWAYGNRQDYVKQAEYFRKAAELQPHTAIFLAHYAEALACLGQLDEAREAINRAEAMEPENLAVLGTKFVYLYRYYPDREMMEETLRRMLPLSTEPAHLNFEFARFHIHFNEFEQAFEYGVKSFLINPEDKWTKILLQLLEQYGFDRESVENSDLQSKINCIVHYSNSRDRDDWQKCLDACLDVLKEKPHHTFAMYQLTRVYMDLGNPDAAARTASEALEFVQEPQFRGFFYEVLGNVRRDRKDLTEAVAYYQKAIDCAPNNGSYYVDLAFVLEDLGRKDEAQGALFAAEKLYPSDLGILREKFKFFHRFRRNREIEEETLKQLQSLLDDMSTIAAFWGDIYYKYGEYQNAYDFFTKALINGFVRDDINQKLSQLGQWVRERHQYEKKLALIRHYSDIDSFDNARLICLYALDYAPHNGWLLMVLTRAYYGLRHYEDCTRTGMEALTQLSSLEEKAYIYYIFGLERMANGDHVKAAEYYEKAVNNSQENMDYITAYKAALAHLGR